MACNIRLQFPTKNSVNETTALTGIGNSWGLPTRLSMEHIENSNEELVSILLLVASKMACMSPHKVKQLVGNIWNTFSRVKLHGGPESKTTQ